MLPIAKTVLKNLTFSAILVVCWCGCLWAENWPATGLLRIDLDLRAGPTAQSLKAFSLKKGSKVTIIGQEGQWLKVVCNGQSGFLRNSARLIKIVSENSQDALQKRQSINQDIESLTQKVQEYSETEKLAIGDLNEIAKKLNRTSLQIAKYQSELLVIEKKISQIQKESDELTKKIQALETDVSQRLIALYKLQRLGQLSVIGSARSIHEFIQRKTAFQYILADDQRLMQTLSDSQVQLDALFGSLELQKNDKDRLRKELKIQAATLKAENARREQLLASIQNHKALALAAIDNLKEAAAELDRTLEDFEAASPASSQKYPPYEDFTKLKGLLNMPVQGMISGAFGPYRNPRFNVDNFRSGIEIKAEKGEPVRSVCRGRVLYAQWFQSYGKMIIIDHGNGYYTVYAHAEELFKAKDDPVETGEVIATVGDTGSMAGCTLYFEIRRHGKPINPAEWIKKS